MRKERAKTARGARRSISSEYYDSPYMEKSICDNESKSQPHSSSNYDEDSQNRDGGQSIHKGQQYQETDSGYIPRERTRSGHHGESGESDNSNSMITRPKSAQNNHHSSQEDDGRYTRANKVSDSSQDSDSDDMVKERPKTSVRHRCYSQDPDHTKERSKSCTSLNNQRSSELDANGNFGNNDKVKSTHTCHGSASPRKRRAKTARQSSSSPRKHHQELYLQPQVWDLMNLLEDQKKLPTYSKR